MPKLRIERTIKVIHVLEINEDMYPGMNPQEARDSEYAQEFGEKVQLLVESLDGIDFEKPLNWGEVGMTGEFFEVVSIVDEEHQVHEGWMLRPE